MGATAALTTLAARAGAPRQLRPFCTLGQGWNGVPHSSRATVWDQLAPRYAAQREHDPVYRACLTQTLAALAPRGRVLDAGCGIGMGTACLLGCLEVTALDFSAASLRELRARLGTPHNLSAVQGDVRALPFPDGAFDRVLCANTLQHLDPEAQGLAARELLRVLRPAGRYAVSAHHFSRRKRRRRWRKEGVPGERGIDYVFRFSRAELAALFPGAAIRAAGFNTLPGALQNPASRLAGGTLSRLEAGHMLIASGVRPPH